MAVQQWELVERERRTALTLVETVPAPPQGRPGAAALFVLFVVLAVGTPSIAASLQDGPEPQRWVPRPRPATELSSIDPIAAVERPGRPTSGRPFAGILFVRCTRLWSALPDGSQARKVLEMPGISSPAIAPNARTVAFFVTTSEGQELWMSGADGTDARRIGRLASSGSRLLSRADALMWSPKGDELAFALVDGRYGEFEGGAAIWTLDLDTGRFSRQGSGWPAPFWSEGHVAWASMGDARWAQFASPDNRRGWIVRNLRTSKHDLAAALVPDGYSTNHRRGAAILRVAGDRPLLIVKDTWQRRVRKKDVRSGPPAGYSFAEHARPSISQDGSSVAITLVDGGGESDLGVFDTRTGRWKVLDYAWDPSVSPAPIASGPLGARRAVTVVTDLLGSWNQGGTRRNLLVSASDRGAFPFETRWTGYLYQPPRRVGRDWAVPVSVYGMTGEVQAWRSATLVVVRKNHRLTVDVTDLSDTHPLETISDAVTFAETALGRDVAAPSLPPQAELRSGSLWASSYDGRRSISFSVTGVPGTASRQGESDLTFGYGDELDFTMGCGGEVDPSAIQLDDTAAVADSSGGTHQVIWPSTMEDRTGTHSIYGYGFKKADIVEIARKMASSGS